MATVDIEMLRNQPLLEGARLDVVEDLAKVAVERRFRPGQVIFEEGSTGRELYLVIEGLVEVVKGQGAEEMVLARRGPEDFFGEMGLIEASPRFATIRALEPTRLLEFSEQEMNSVLIQQPLLLYQVTQVLSARLREADLQMITDLQRKNQELARAYLELQEAQEKERRRIARELHDGVGPALASLNIRLRTARKLLERDHHPVAEEIEELAELAQANIQDIRCLIHDLRPAALDELGLVPALREYVARYQEEQGLEVALALPALSPAEGPEGDKRLPAPLETALFRIVQEALANVAKHAQAQRVEVTMTRDREGVTLRVADDGRGFDPQAPRPGTHLGLWSMRERVEQLGGQFEIESAPGRGTKLMMTISHQANVPSRQGLPLPGTREEDE
jgi:signal transduction histidine kinase